MPRLAVGLMIALAALVMNGGFVKLARAETPPPATLRPTPPQSTTSSSGRVLSLLVALEALRAAPEVLDTRKV